MKPWRETPGVWASRGEEIQSLREQGHTTFPEEEKEKRLRREGVYVYGK